MNTDRVKDIVIGLLSAFIVLFSVLIFMDERQFVLSAAHEENIVATLNRNNITISADVEIPRNFRPMRQMAMQRYSHDLRAKALRFFGDTPFAYNHEIFSAEFYCEATDKYIWHDLNTNQITFRIPQGLLIGEAYDNFTKNAATAEELARAFIREILDPNLDLVLHSNDLTPRGDYTLTLFANYRDYLLYDTQVRIRVTELGIVHATYSRIITQGFIGEPRPIFSTDEALLSLLNYLRSQDIHAPADIIQIRPVYLLQERGIPAYLFTLVIQDIQLDFLFNAFTNTYIDSFSRN